MEDERGAFAALVAEHPTAGDAVARVRRDPKSWLGSGRLGEVRRLEGHLLQPVRRRRGGPAHAVREVQDRQPRRARAAGDSSCPRRASLSAGRSPPPARRSATSRPICCRPYAKRRPDSFESFRLRSSRPARRPDSRHRSSRHCWAFRFARFTGVGTGAQTAERGRTDVPGHCRPESKGTARSSGQMTPDRQPQRTVHRRLRRLRPAAEPQRCASPRRCCQWIQPGPRRITRVAFAS